MKRYLYLFPLMAFTAATLALGGCDDPNKDEQAAADQAAVTTPATTDAMTATTDTMAPAATASVVSAEGATSYATAEGSTTGAVFLTLQNTGTEADKLVGVTTAKGMAEIHESYVDATDGTMQMRKVDGVEVGAGQQVALKPDGYHIMIMGLTAPLVQGETFDVTLDFDKAADVTVPVTITAPGDASGTTAAPMASDDATSAMPSSDTTAAAPVTETPATDEPMATTPSTTEAPDAPAADVPVTDEQPAQ